MVSAGIDIIEIERLERAVKRHPRLLARLFTAAEQEYCLSRKQSGASLAARFAAKEAVMKALGDGAGRCAFREIEIARAGEGPPRVVLYGQARQLARELGAGEITVSLSHCRAYATAVAIIHFYNGATSARREPAPPPAAG
ncbi:MAG: holo-[acyl-carrier protein] synthase [Clostridia bacterium]|nr:holo-[acyl-carrier protein] synthase [Clostridia bacterium]